MVPKEILKNWPHKWYGIWDWDSTSNYSPEQRHKYGLYDPQLYFRSGWMLHDLDQILDYLRSGKSFLSAGYRGKCHLCEESMHTEDYRTDGIWTWKSDLTHYVEKHSLAIPDSLIEHIRRQNYIIRSIQLNHLELSLPLGVRRILKKVLGIRENLYEDHEIDEIENDLTLRNKNSES